MSIPDQISNGAPHGGGITPPQNLEAEQSVLGALLMGGGSISELHIEVNLRAEDFYRASHGTIFAAMQALEQRNDPIDVLTVADLLESTGQLEQIGGKSALESLAVAVPALAHVRQYARMVREHALMRALLATAYAIQQQVAERAGTPGELVDQAERAILEVAQDDRRKDFRSIHDLLDFELDKLVTLSKEGAAITGTPSGFEDLDRMTGGFQPGNLIILAARPSMGKSALMANFCEHAALNADKAVALFSLEMSETELAQRFIASQASVKGDDLRKGRIQDTRWPKIYEASNRLAQSPLFVDDSSELSVLDMRAKSRRLAQQQPNGLGLIVVDYLQLMRADRLIENRTEAIGTISRGLKQLARELLVPVIALSQLNRGVEQRTDKRPMLSDLRESGAIEQDADLVMMIYRDEYYNEDSDREGIADLIVAKHRNGGLGTVELTFQKDYPRFMSYSGGDGYA